MKISNLDDLRKITDETIIKKIVMEYMLETIARASILVNIEGEIARMNEKDTLTVDFLRKKINEAVVNCIDDIV